MTGSIRQDDALVRLFYTSRAMLDDADGDPVAQVAQIAAQAAASNRQAGLTGCLLFMDGLFAQVLEGPAMAVEALFEAICRDFRHREVKLIDFGAASSRLYPDWHMAVLVDDAQAGQSLRTGLQDVRYMIGVNAAEALRQIRDLLDAQAPAAA